MENLDAPKMNQDVFDLCPVVFFLPVEVNVLYNFVKRPDCG